MKGKFMKKAIKSHRNREMLEEYDFSKGVRGKYATRYREGSNVLVLDPDVAKVFHDPYCINQALRALAESVRQQSKKIPA
jgi:hypothetical protein